MGERPDISIAPSYALRWMPKSRATLVVLIALAGAGLVAAGALVAFMVATIAGEPRAQAVENATWGALGALSAALVGLVVVPLVRRVIVNREDVRILEAASPLHPLLKRLMTEAPGTYTHSLAAASLAEAGAEAIGADALLARVGAYYHDVGKIRRPCFFFENLAEGENPHDTAKPSLSALIITSHVTDGLELAEEYGLPMSLRDIIREHHGTSLIRYFYHKATQEDAGVFEADYRYHGGRPTTREAGLVMMADSSEAAVRALKEPSADGVAAVVRFVIDDKVQDGQLELSGLTPEDIETVRVTFSRMLVSMLHARCEYPQPLSAPRREAHADQRREPSRA